MKYIFNSCYKIFFFPSSMILWALSKSPNTAESLLWKDGLYSAIRCAHIVEHTAVLGI